MTTFTLCAILALAIMQQLRDNVRDTCTDYTQAAQLSQDKLHNDQCHLKTD